jgi:murein DD-endopeptidase MepM/ murein hydrolase activator NlpD
MRARLKTLTTITAVLLAVTAVFVAGAPTVLRRRPRTTVRQLVRTAVRRSHPRLIVAASVALFLVAGVVGSAVERHPETASASPSFRLAASSDTTTTSTTAAPVTTTTAPPAPPTTVAPPPPPDPNALIWPVRAAVWSGFGLRSGRRHTGTDIGGAPGSTIVAAQAGVVTYAGWESGYGQEVRIDHGGGISTLYAHMARMHVRAGQRVGQGQPIGTVGSTGRVSAPHLHFEVRIGGVPQNPMRWLANAR